MSDGIGEIMSFDRFEAWIGTEFVWIDDDGAPTFSLVEARSLGSTGSPAPFTPFSLLFAVSDARVVEQGTYRLRHEQGGEIDIFLVPVARGEAGLMFEAIFN